jgi:FixJ family two-component response regulator
MSEVSPDTLPADPRGGELIAVVDDDSRVLESLEDLLKSSGYRTLLCLSAEEFLESPHRPHVRALISDIGLPGMSGIELVRTLRQCSQHVPTILITGRTEAHLAQDASGLELLCFLAKPFDTSQLLDILTRQFTADR